MKPRDSFAMIQAHGKGQDGARCEQCRFLVPTAGPRPLARTPSLTTFNCWQSPWPAWSLKYPACALFEAAS